MCAPPTMRTIFYTHQPPYPRPRTHERRNPFGSRDVPDSQHRSRVPPCMHNLRLCGARARKPTFHPPPKFGGPGKWVFSMGCSVGLGFSGVCASQHPHVCMPNIRNHVLRSHVITHNTIHTPHTHNRRLEVIGDSMSICGSAGPAFWGHLRALLGGCGRAPM